MNRTNLNDRPLIQANDTEPQQLAIKAAVDIQAREGKRPTFTIDLYSGAPLRLAGFFDPVVIDLAGEIRQRPSGVKILRDHDPAQIVGHATDVQVNSDGIKVEGIVSGTGPAAKEVVENAKAGFPWEASIGGMPSRIEFIESGDEVEVNGQTLDGPLNVVRAMDMNEGSFVAIGADKNTAADVAAMQSKKEQTKMNFQKWLKAKGITEADCSEAVLKQLRAAFDVEQRQIAAQDGGGDGDDSGDDDETDEASGDVDADVDAETEPEGVTSSAGTQAIRANAGRELKRIAAIGKIEGISADLQARAIEGGWSLQKAELEVLRASRPQASSRRISDGEREGTAKVLTAALCMSAGIQEARVGKMFDDKTMEAALSSQNRGASIQSVMDYVLQAAGDSYVGSRASNDYIRQVFESSQKLAAAGFTSLSLPGILGNTANKAMNAAYTAVNVIWNQFCAIRSHADFKVNTRYRLDSTGAFKKIGQDGELKHIGLDEASHTNQVDTYGALIALTRQTIINDDLGAFLQIPQLIGRMSALRIEEAVFALLLSNPSSFFSAGNGNLKTGAASALAIDGLTDAEQAFADMVDSNGKPVLVNGRTLISGTALKVDARRLFNDSALNETTTTNKAKTAVNPHQGKFEPFASPYVNNTNVTDQDGKAITGQSATAWWLFADPADRAAMAVAFLNGQQMPTIESAQTSFETLGVQWRGYHDFGVGMEDPNAAVQNNGV